MSGVDLYLLNTGDIPSLTDLGIPADIVTLAEYEPLKDFADSVSFPVDQINYVVCLLLAYPLGVLFRQVPLSLPGLRHLFGIVFGLAFGIFCFRFFMFHAFFTSILTYTILAVFSPNISHKMVFVLLMTYLVLMHLYRQIVHSGSYVLDITGPQMILTQKLTYFAFAYHDGQSKDPKKQNAAESIKKLPSLLEYFGHVFFFAGFLAGPMHTFPQYMDTIKGTGYKAPVAFTAIGKLIVGFACMGIKMLPGFYGFSFDRELSKLRDAGWLAKNSFPSRCLEAYITCVLVRMQYYFGWNIADGANNIAGMGYTGKDWTGVQNVNVLKVEFATSLREVLSNWNIRTQSWLIFVCYNRTKSVTMTMLLSAIWHGTSPGYALTFLYAAFLTEAARKMRREFHPRFQGSEFTRRFYDVITWFATCLYLMYTVGPFVILDFWPAIEFWKAFYFLGHITIAVVLVLPIGKKKKTEKKVEKKTE